MTTAFDDVVVESSTMEEIFEFEPEEPLEGFLLQANESRKIAGEEMLVLRILTS
jgi:hypothetical protein